MKSIFEMPIYDGRTKEWRILNISTGTIYAGSDETEESSFSSIKHGKVRAGKKVSAIRLKELRNILENRFALLKFEPNVGLIDVYRNDSAYKPYFNQDQSLALTSDMKCDCCEHTGSLRYHGFKGRCEIISIAKCTRCGHEQDY